MQLLVNGSCVEIAQMGPDFLLVNNPIDHVRDEANILLEVDGRARSWKILLPEGITTTSNRVSIAPV